MSETEPFFLTYDAGLPFLPTLRVLVLDELEEARRILAELKEKSEFVDWNKGERLEHFGLIAKRLEEKENLRARGYLCYDLEDIQKM